MLCSESGGPEMILHRPADFDQHLTTARQGGRFLPQYEYLEHPHTLNIDDPVWGRETIGRQEGDEVFLELFKHPVFQRLAGIEQLTLPEKYATMPGTCDFTRWEHAWGSVVFVRKMIAQAEGEGRLFNAREKLILQLRTFVSDAGHTAFSHLGDWLKQSFGGSEDDHDQTLEDFLERSGVCDVLRRHDIDPQEVIFPEGQDWVECDSPDLCVDRVDYGAREIMRWVDPSYGEVWRRAFCIDDQNRLIMQSERAARHFGLAFGLLATEHWSHPVHRLQLQLFGEIIKEAILKGDAGWSNDTVLHPIDQLYAIDRDILNDMRTHGAYNKDLHTLLLHLGREQREVFGLGKERDIAQFVSRICTSAAQGEQRELSFPHPLRAESWQAQESGVKPQNVELIRVQSAEEAEKIEALPHALDVYLPAYKPRSVDPLYRDAQGRTHRLSEQDATYARLLKECRAIQAERYVARIYLAPDAVQKLRDRLMAVDRQWVEQLRAHRSEASIAVMQEGLPLLGRIALLQGPNTVVAPYPLQ